MEYHEENYGNGRNYLLEYDPYNSLVQLIKDTHNFMDRFSFLQFGRNSIVTKVSTIFSINLILDSTVRSLYSILLCSEYGHFTDVTILIRKYRDDLFFYLYLVSVGNSCDLLSEDLPSNEEKNIKKWQSNELSDLHITQILRYIGTQPKTKTAVEKYNLKSNMDQIATNLNNYVHANGINFYNRHPQNYTKEEIQLVSNSIGGQLNYITVIFIFLLTLCQPLSIMASDYIDYMDCGDIPPENSQYWVAPFIEEYLKKYGHLLGKDSKEYLKKETGMET